MRRRGQQHSGRRAATRVSRGPAAQRHSDPAELSVPQHGRDRRRPTRRRIHGVSARRVHEAHVDPDRRRHPSRHHDPPAVRRRYSTAGERPVPCGHADDRRARRRTSTTTPGRRLGSCRPNRPSPTSRGSPARTWARRRRVAVPPSPTTTVSPGPSRTCASASRSASRSRTCSAPGPWRSTTSPSTSASTSTRPKSCSPTTSRTVCAHAATSPTPRRARTTAGSRSVRAIRNCRRSPWPR